MRIDFCDRVRNSADAARLADRQGRAVIGARSSRRDPTYGEGYSLDGADGVAAIARIAGAAQYLMTIHGIAHAHTRERRELDHRPAARSAVPFAVTTSPYPDARRRRRRSPASSDSVSAIPDGRVTRLRSTRHDDRAAATRPSLNRRPHERHRRVFPAAVRMADWPSKAASVPERRPAARARVLRTRVSISRRGADHLRRFPPAPTSSTKD